MLRNVEKRINPQSRCEEGIEMAESFVERISSIIGHEDVWLTPDEVSRITGFTVGTLNTWRSRHKGPIAVVVGRSARYSARELRAWMLAHVTKRSGSARA